MTLRNRIIKAATSEGRSPDGMVTDDLIAFHRSFAEGGVGMTTVAYCCVSPGRRQRSRPDRDDPGRRCPACAASSRRPRAGAAISAQLGHAGIVAPKKLTGVTPIAPSRFINPASLAYCREITRDEIRMVIDQFGAAARVAVDAGFDAVELHFGHLYLPSSFLSPLFNRRKDDYGGDIDNRSRLVREIASAGREVIGDRMAVIAKLDHGRRPARQYLDRRSLAHRAIARRRRTLDAIELTQGSSVFKPMYLFRGDVPVREFSRFLPPPLRPGIRLVGKRTMGELPLRRPLHARGRTAIRSRRAQHQVDSARRYHQPRSPPDRTARGFRLRGDGSRAAARTRPGEPDDRRPRARSRCTHNNKCMVTVFGRTHCVLDPDQRYGAVSPAPQRLPAAVQPTGT